MSQPYRRFLGTLSSFHLFPIPFPSLSCHLPLRAPPGRVTRWRDGGNGRKRWIQGYLLPRLVHLVGSLVWCLLRCSPYGFLPHSSPYPAEPDRFASEPGPSGDMMTEEERDRRDRRVKGTGGGAVTHSLLSSFLTLRASRVSSPSAPYGAEPRPLRGDECKEWTNEVRERR